MERLTDNTDYCASWSDCEMPDGKCEFLNNCYDRKIYNKLREYEDAEEQGLLIRLPCKVADTIFRINPYAKEPIISMKVLQIRFVELYSGNSFLRIDAINDEDMGEFCYFKNDIGKTVFLTREEAEAALAEMNKKENINE